MSVLRCARLAVTVLAFGLSFPAIADPAQDAKAAYDGRDYATALRIWGELAEQGNPEAQVNLGILYAQGQGVTKDESAAVQLFRRAAENGNLRGQNVLGHMYENGRGVANDDAEAVQWYRKAADEGYAAAQSNLGHMYEKGRGVARDDAESVKWYRKAAEQDFATAQASLGFMYENGRGVAKDDGVAVAWFHKSAVQGNVFAQTSLGVMYEAGRGVAKDEVAAAQWYRRAAEQGFALGQNNLGVLYRDGHGVAKDDAEAVQWFRKAADQGYARAQNNLGFMYQYGWGVATDVAAAVTWYRRAAEQGEAMAQTNLGRMYQHGWGVAEDEAAAVEWFQKAAKQGETNAQAILASIGNRERAAAADSAPAIAALVKKYEAAQPAAPVPDAERAALAREIVAATRTSEKLSYLPERFREGTGGRAASKLSPKLLETLIATGLASFRPDRILGSWERWLADGIDAPTLRAGLEWERSDIGRRINQLELEAEAPEHNAARTEFVVQFVKRAGTGDDSRGRACAQKDILDGSADAVLPFLEAMAATGAMLASIQQAPAPNMDMIEQMIVAVRPMLRDAARQSSLANCAFALRSLSDAEFDQLLAFLRTDAGGRYARGSTVAMRRALLEASEVFTRTVVDVARQLKPSGQT